MTYGVTSAGFIPKPTVQIVSDVSDAQKAQPALGPNQDYGTASALGQLNGTLGGTAGEIWELVASVVTGFDPNSALGQQLIALCALTGTVQRPATSTLVPATVNLNAGATLPAGSVAAETGRPDLLFASVADVTNSGGSAANFSAVFACLQTGPVACPAGALTVRQSTVTGWNSVTNAADGVVGRNIDDPITLRARRQAQLALRGGSTVGAIQAALLDSEGTPELAGVESAKVLTNRTAAIDVNGLPPHSFEALIDDGPTPSVADNTLASVIWASQPAGIASNGSSSGTVVDAFGVTQTVSFSRITRRSIYLSLTVTRGAGFPIDGAAQIQAALVAAGGLLAVGAPVIAAYMRSIAFSVPGVTDVPVFTLDFTAVPTNTANLAIGARERATFDTSRIVVTLA